VCIEYRRLVAVLFSGNWTHHGFSRHWRALVPGLKRELIVERAGLYSEADAPLPVGLERRLPSWECSGIWPAHSRDAPSPFVRRPLRAVRLDVHHLAKYASASQHRRPNKKACQGVCGTYSGAAAQHKNEQVTRLNQAASKGGRRFPSNTGKHCRSPPQKVRGGCTPQNAWPNKVNRKGNQRTGFALAAICHFKATSWFGRAHANRT